MCDGKRIVLKDEAALLLRQGILKGLFSPIQGDRPPAWVWSVDDSGEVYEAKGDGERYHGYRLGTDDNWRSHILTEWSRR